MRKKSSRSPRPQKPAKSAARPARAQPVCPIVAIGASAGGLEALTAFLKRVPTGSGLAFVIVQHLDPTRRGIMPELLQRDTRMKVMQVRDQMPIRPNCVYVIPPNKNMSVLHGILHLFAPAAPRGLRLPIDFFFRSLAQDQQERSIGVILSGMGSDGTLGLRAIKEVAGLALAQTPATAKFDSMPRSAVDAGLTDIVAPAGDLPAKILACVRRTSARGDDGERERNPSSRSALEKAVILLRSRTGHDFSPYKRNTLHRRIERRMAIHQLTEPGDYIQYLQQNPQEVDLLFKELLIGVTNFFRDPPCWEQLLTETIPPLLANRQPGQALRAWVAGCSTGEEAYSLAMIFREAIDRLPPEKSFTLKIFATDLDRDAIERARQAVFPKNIAADVSEERLKRFFVPDEQGYRVRREVREMVIFAPQNLIMDPPFTKLDLLSCRNLLIYLGAEVQAKLIPLFHYSLNPGGILLLGNAETIGRESELFVPLPGKSRIFQRADVSPPLGSVALPCSFVPEPLALEPPPSAAKPALSLQTVADQVMLQRYAPPAVLVNEKGDICYVSGRTGKYLEPAAGKANWNVFAMAREDLRYELSGGFQKALRQKEPVVLPNIKIASASGEERVDVTLQRLDEDGALEGLVMVIFTARLAPHPLPPETSAAKAGSRHRRIGELEQELRQSRTDARNKTEEMQIYQEELRSANEELQSTIEELQSTNEELTTSKEEMQSLNEEQQTLNTELQAKVDELSHSSNDMKNLLNSTDIATLFLDNDLKVRRFTPQATKIIKLIPGDVGRPITDLVSDLEYPALIDDVHAVLRTQISVEKSVATKDGRWFALRIMLYRTMDDRIDGVVITFTDITTSKGLEEKLRTEHALLARQVAAQAARAAGRKQPAKTPARP